MPMFKRILFAALLAFTVIPLFAQEKADTTFVFRFPVESDTLFAAYHNNIAELRRMYDLVERHKPQILNGDIPLLVDGYCNSKNSTQENQAIAKIRSNRVKSELIVHTGLTEACFITQNHVEKGDFVTVRITIAKDDIPSTLPEKDTATPVENKKEEVVVAPQEEQVTHSEEALPSTTSKADYNNSLSLRANLLRWATLTTDIGIEWRINPNWGILVNGTWTSWSWNNAGRRYALWEVTPQIRHYIGKEKRGYLGAMFKTGQFNYKLSDTGKQGDLTGSGIAGGYVVKLNKALALDLGLGVGYLHTDYDKYVTIDGVRVRQGSETKNWWGPINADITLVWTLF